MVDGVDFIAIRGGDQWVEGRFHKREHPGFQFLTWTNRKSFTANPATLAPHCVRCSAGESAKIYRFSVAAFAYFAVQKSLRKKNEHFTATFLIVTT
jgi:hypothetical protein